MNSSPDGDMQVWAIMMLLTLGLVFLPFIPGLRWIPRLDPCLWDHLAPALSRASWRVERLARGPSTWSTERRPPVTEGTYRQKVR